ncbi:MAG: ribosome small subunit-dependent GTPase A [Tissierellia bacterium]|nr:ribosome small subunit-dependent GTPase A [Tissierellia bacterium]
MLEGIIIKGIGGFYYVDTVEGVYECRARGIFREQNITPLIGDRVSIRLSEEDDTGYIERIHNRRSQLLRPSVANITQVVIVMSIKKPDINYWLLDRFLVMAEYEGLDVHICINKIDLHNGDTIDIIDSIYSKIDYKVIKTSSKTGEGISNLKDILEDNITVFAGPSGVGKSSLLNRIDPKLNLKTGDVSRKTTRGRHTTRHVELMDLGAYGYVVDSPGFSSLDLDFIEDEVELGQYFREIGYWSQRCRFIGCLHHREPGCEVKKQVLEQNISDVRYQNYLQFLEELKNIRRY